MSTITDFHAECARVQLAIEQHLGMQGRLVYDFGLEDSKIKLNLITVNARHNQSFLFQTTVGVDKLDALQKMLAYVREHVDSESSFTIQWRVKGDKELHTSYFRAKNMYEALDKLYYNRDVNAITVYSLVMNPAT